MDITLRYQEHSPGSCVRDGKKHMRTIDVPESTDISQLCERLQVDMIAEYEFDGLGSGGHVIGKWMDSGPLKDSTTYLILNFEDGRRKGLKRLERFKYDQ